MEKSAEEKNDCTYVGNKKSALQSVGEFIKEARQGRNISVEDLSSSLRIGKEQLIALESGDENALPEKVFIRAMVRRIAEKLNLDTSFILDELNEKKKVEPKSNPVSKKKNTIKSRNFFPLSMVILSGTLGLFASIALLKYLQVLQNDSSNLQQEFIFLFDKDINS